MSELAVPRTLAGAGGPDAGGRTEFASILCGGSAVHLTISSSSDGAVLFAALSLVRLRPV